MPNYTTKTVNGACYICKVSSKSKVQTLIEALWNKRNNKNNKSIQSLRDAVSACKGIAGKETVVKYWKQCHDKVGFGSLIVPEHTKLNPITECSSDWLEHHGISSNGTHPAERLKKTIQCG